MKSFVPLQKIIEALGEQKKIIKNETIFIIKQSNISTETSSLPILNLFLLVIICLTFVVAFCCVFYCYFKKNHSFQVDQTDQNQLNRIQCLSRQDNRILQVLFPALAHRNDQRSHDQKIADNESISLCKLSPLIIDREKMLERFISSESIPYSLTNETELSKKASCSKTIFVS